MIVRLVVMETEKIYRLDGPSRSNSNLAIGPHKGDRESLPASRHHLFAMGLQILLAIQEELFGLSMEA